jgi:hypothetical protein
MNRSSPSWSARTGRSPERGRTGKENCRSPKFVCFGAEAKTVGDYAALVTRQLVTKSMANSGGDGETPGGARRPKPSGQNESDLERRGASKFKAGCLRQRPWSD